MSRRTHLCGSAADVRCARGDRADTGLDDTGRPAQALATGDARRRGSRLFHLVRSNCSEISSEAVSQTTSLSAPHHRLDGEEASVYGAHVDVPGLSLRGLPSRQVTHRCQTRTEIGSRRTDQKFTLEGINRDSGVRNGTIAVRQVEHVALPELAGP